MSAFLWKYFYEDDFQSFRQILASASFVGAQSKAKSAGAAHFTPLSGSPGLALATSPSVKSKGKARKGAGTINLSRADINSKNAEGTTLLHCVAASSAPSAFEFASALLDLPYLDLYIQDAESGWTALHRALYHGNVRVAHALLERDIQDHGLSASNHVGGLIKIKDSEGNSPFDLYATTVAPRAIAHGHQMTLDAAENGSSISASDSRSLQDAESQSGDSTCAARVDVAGDEIFTFGSNKNLNLGVGNEDDRQFPERINVTRPESLVDKLNSQVKHLRSLSDSSKGSSKDARTDDIPALVKLKPIEVQDVKMAKYHTAVLTGDHEANLYVCGFGPSGRLGVGDTSTRFRLTSVLGGGLARKKVIAVALGQDHTVAITNRGEVFTWGSNKSGQLGFTPPAPLRKDDDPVQLVPRQVFGVLKRELIIGCAASALHSAVFSSSSLFTFGKNEGQLGLVDANAASLRLQASPRKVAASLFSSNIEMVSAIDRATICLLENYDVWVLANFGYSKVAFQDVSVPREVLSSFGSRQLPLGKVIKICSGGDTVCALSDQGEVFTVTVRGQAPPRQTSTTNPNKIRGLLSQPQKLWSLRKEHMAVHDVDVGQDGSIIICTQAGSVWRRIKRAKIQDPDSKGGYIKDHKFSRIPSLNRACAVRSNAFGAFAVVRREDDTVMEQMTVSPSKLWQDIFPLLPIRALPGSSPMGSSLIRSASNLQVLASDVAGIRDAFASSEEFEKDMST